METKTELRDVNSEFRGKKKSELWEKKSRYFFFIFFFRGRNELPHNSGVSGKPQLSESLFLIGSVSLSRALSCLLPMDYWNILWWKAAVFLLSKRWIWMLNDTKTTRSTHNFPYNDKNKKNFSVWRRRRGLKYLKTKNLKEIKCTWAAPELAVWSGGAGWTCCPTNQNRGQQNSEVDNRSTRPTRSKTQSFGRQINE